MDTIQSALLNVFQTCPSREGNELIFILYRKEQPTRLRRIANTSFVTLSIDSNISEDLIHRELVCLAQMKPQYYSYP